MIKRNLLVLFFVLTFCELSYSETWIFPENNEDLQAFKKETGEFYEFPSQIEIWKMLESDNVKEREKGLLLRQELESMLSLQSVEVNGVELVRTLGGVVGPS